MYVFLYVCMHACTVCMYACMYACISYTRLPTCWSSMKEKRNYTNREKKAHLIFVCEHVGAVWRKKEKILKEKCFLPHTRLRTCWRAECAWQWRKKEKILKVNVFYLTRVCGHVRERNVRDSEVRCELVPVLRPLYACMHVCMYACIYVCVYICT